MPATSCDLCLREFTAKTKPSLASAYKRHRDACRKVHPVTMEVSPVHDDRPIPTADPRTLRGGRIYSQLDEGKETIRLLDGMGVRGEQLEAERARIVQLKRELVRRQPKPKSIWFGIL